MTGKRAQGQLLISLKTATRIHPMLFRLLMIIFLSISSAVAQQPTKSVTLPQMPPLMDRQKEIGFALSAAPRQ